LKQITKIHLYLEINDSSSSDDESVDSHSKDKRLSVGSDHSNLSNTTPTRKESISSESSSDTRQSVTSGDQLDPPRHESSTKNNNINNNNNNINNNHLSVSTTKHECKRNENNIIETKKYK
jgi:hypothetical protein